MHLLELLRRPRESFIFHREYVWGMLLLIMYGVRIILHCVCITKKEYNDMSNSSNPHGVQDSFWFREYIYSNIYISNYFGASLCFTFINIRHQRRKKQPIRFMLLLCKSSPGSQLSEKSQIIKKSYYLLFEKLLFIIPLMSFSEGGVTAQWIFSRYQMFDILCPRRTLSSEDDKGAQKRASYKLYWIY